MDRALLLINMLDYLMIYIDYIFSYIQSDWFFILYCFNFVLAIILLIKYSLFGKL